MSQKLDDPIYPSPTKDTLNLPSPIKDDRTTSEVVDVDEELERMEKEEFEKRFEIYYFNLSQYYFPVYFVSLKKCLATYEQIN